ncbi:hypothetical protein FJZ53_01330 [Candidatus Woesearchaeota archaeon]|nr:hypothetical protein [Candidatus Woesearchaeota archaeon]
MPREPCLLGFDKDSVTGLMDYYEVTMADTNLVAGIAGRDAVFNAAVRRLGYHKVVGEDDFISDGHSAVINGKVRKFAKKQADLKGKKFNVDRVEKDNYLLGMGLEQILGMLSSWHMNDELIAAFSERGLSQKTIDFFRSNRKLNLTVDAIPEGIPIFPHEPYLSIKGTFEQCQFPESLILGTWGYQTAIATQASYIINILSEFGKTDVITLEGGSRRAYPPAALAATRATLAAGFKGTSNVEIVRQYPELLYKIGGSSAHSAVLHIGNDFDAFELQLMAYFRINHGDSEAVKREKIRQTKGIGPTFLIDTFSSDSGLTAAIAVMKKYGIQCQIRNDSNITSDVVKKHRKELNAAGLDKSRIMISNDLKPWIIYDLLEKGAEINSLLIGTFAVNPYRLPGAAYKLAAHQRGNDQTGKLENICKVCIDEPSKGTLPGQLDVYRVIGKDGKADRDVILSRGVDKIDDFLKHSDKHYMKLNQEVMRNGEITYDLPDMCAVIERTAEHLNMLRPEHKRFKGAKPYDVIISDTVKKIQESVHKKFVEKKLY